MKKIKWGIIGSGKIARRFASDLMLLDSAILIGSSSRNNESNNIFSEEFGITPFSSFDQLLSSDVDVVYIATPHSSHREHSIKAILAGKAVLCEKPFAMKYSEAQEIIDHAKLKNVFVMEAMWTRFFPAIQEIIELVRSGRIGKLLRIESSFGYESVFDPNSRVFNPHLGGGSLLDVGVYCISLARMLTEESLQEIHCKSQLSSTGVDESASWTITFPSGAIAVGKSSVTNILENEARIIGTNGEIHIPQFWRPKEYFLNGEKRTFEFEGMGFQFEAMEVIDCLKKGLTESPRMPHAHTLDVIKTMDTIRKLINKF
jgi:dihydrodiol dehydrogenase / D-xylose 1-dehydrogenase (NADP)